MLDIIKNKKTVVAIGKFDGFHIGHQKLLTKARQIAKENNLLSLILFVGKPFPSLSDDKDREEMAKKLGIDICARVELDSHIKNMTGEEFVDEIIFEKLNASHVVVGENFRFAKNRSKSAADLFHICKEKGIEVTVVDEVRTVNETGEEKTVSSSYIKELISKSDVETVTKLLSRPYCILGEVKKGRQIGKTIGMPTANIETGEKVVFPQGVYATFCRVGDKTYPSVTNIGTNPTVSDDGKLTIETHILFFDEDIYNKEIEIGFLEKIREEKKFESLEKLKIQTNKDIEYVKTKYEKINV